MTNWPMGEQGECAYIFVYLIFLLMGCLHDAANV